MNIVIMGEFGFPHGYGELARIHAYARGLMANGAHVKVICLKALERGSGKAANTESQGIYNGVPFEYACGTSMRASSFLGRRWLEIKGAMGLWRLLGRGTPAGKFDAIILFSNDPIWILLTVIRCKLIKARCIQEKSEFPLVYKKQTFSLKIYSAIYTRTIYRLFDGILAISTYLEQYFLKRIRKGARVLRIPILVDTEQIQPENLTKPGRTLRIVYVGALGHPGEVSSLIQAYSLVAEKHPQWNLQIIGDAPGTDILARMRKMAQDLGLAGRIEFTGMVGRDEIPTYLKNADVLALLRSAGIFSRAGFPTKLGEYLSTGKPVVVTSIGDIPLYLEDKVSAFLVPPDDINAFAQKLDEVLSNYNLALQVGQKGRQVAMDKFDYRSNCQRIVEFIRELQGSPA